MAIQTSAVINSTTDPALIKSEIALATANGGVYVFETTKDIYVTQVEEQVYQSYVTPQYNTIYNSPGNGTVDGAVQFNLNGNFAANYNLYYSSSNSTLVAANVFSAGNVSATGIRTDNFYHANGVAWTFNGATYSNLDVGAYLSSNSSNVSLGFRGNIFPNNITATGAVNLGDVGNLTITEANGVGPSGGQTLVSDGGGGFAFVPAAIGGNLANSTSYISIYSNGVIVSNSAGNTVMVTNPSGTSITGNLSVSGNITATNLSANIVKGNSSINVASNANTVLSANGNVVTVFSSSGDGNAQTTGVNVFGYLNSTGNVIAPNLVGKLANGNSNIAITANAQIVISSNGSTSLTISGTDITAAGNLTASNLIGSYANGNSNVSITGNGNITLSAVGNAGILTVTGTGVNVAGTSNFVGDTSVVGNLNVSGNVNGVFANGNSNITIAANSSILISSAGNANLVTINTSGANIIGNLIVSANITSNRSLYIGANTANSGLVLYGLNGGNTSNVRSISVYPGTNIAANYSLILPNNAPATNALVLGANTDGTTYWTTGATPTSLANGNSNVNIPASNGNVTISAVGNSNIVVVTGTGTNVAGYLTATGNVTGGNINTGGQVAASGNIVGLNLTSNGAVNATGNITGGNLTTGAQVVATGNVTGGNLTTGGQLVATGNVTGGNLLTGGSALVTGNITVGNILANANANIVGALTAGNVTTTKITANGNIAFSGANVYLGQVANLKIAGGSNNQVLTTDGTGNLQWTGGGGSIGSGISNGTSNISIPLNGAVAFGVSGNANVFFVTGTGANANGTLDVVGNTTLANLTANGTINLTGNLNANGANVGLGDVANIFIAGGSNGQYLQTDGNGNVSWSTVAGGTVTAITNGSSNVVVGASSNVTVSVGGTSNVLTVSPTGISTSSLSVNGTVGVTLTSGQFSIAGQILSLGNASGATFILTNSGANRVTTLTANGQMTFSGAGSYNTLQVQGNVDSTNFVNTPNLIVTTGTANFTGTSRVSLGAVGNLRITGGTANYFLQTDGNGIVTWADPGVITPAAIANASNTNTTVTAQTNSVVVAINGTQITTANATLFTVLGNSVVNNNLSAGNISTSGNLYVTGNGSIISDLYVGGNITGNTDLDIGNITSANIQANGTITANFFSGVLDTKSNNQPNITNVGTLGNLNVTANITAGNITANTFIYTTGNLSAANIFSAGIITVTSNANVGGNLNVTGNAIIAGQVRFNGAVDTGTGNVYLANSAFVTLPPAANMSIGGGTGGQFLQQVGGGPVTWTSAVVSSSAPVSNTSTGTAGQIAFDSGYVYICVATNTWKRAALASWP